MKRALVRTLKALLPLFIVAAAGFGALTMIRNRPPVETLTPVVEPPGVRVHEVTLGDAPLAVASQGTVQPRTESQLVPEIAGRVTWVAPSFAQGGFFEAGDVLVKIDPFDYEQMLVSARSQLAQARLRLAQEEAEAEVALREWNTLGRGDPRELALRKPQLDDARASVAAAEASVERATRDLERADIVAPYAGRVRQKKVDIGQYVRVGDEIATVYAVDMAEIRLPLPDGELAYLDLPLSYRGVEQQTQPHVTLRATFAGEQHTWDGRIVRTESEIDSVSRMVHAIAEVADPYAPGPNPNRPPLAVGMYVEAEIGGRTARDVAVLPRQALRGRNEVLVVTPEDRLTFRTIDVLRASTESVIVRAGLQAGELVAISPLDTPTEGMRVQLADADPDLLERRAKAAGDTAPPAPAAATPAEDLPADSEPAAIPASAQALAPAENVPVAAAATATPTEDIPADREPAAIPASAQALAPAEPPASAQALAPAEPADGVAASGMAAPPDGAIRPAWLQALLEEDNRPAGVSDREEPGENPVTTRQAASAPVVEPDPRPAMPPVAVAAPPDPNAVAVASFASLNQGTGDPEIGPALSRAVATRLASADGIAMAGSESDARYVVRGGIQQIGPLVRVTARIVDTSDGAVLHALKIDGTTDDRPTLETDVAAAVVENLAASLGRTARGAPGRMPTGEMPSALAVLPFDDLAAGVASVLDIDLGTAITEAVTEQLAMLPAVAVVTPGDEAVWAIGGGIQRIGSMVRVTARLTDVRSGAVVTAVKVDGTVEALADLQARVAAVLLDSVRDALAGDSIARLGFGTDTATPRHEGRL